ncbi:FliH/SctL family protein [Novosphingobium sp. BL-52-GroH]|uniref:FliH/SctL family protein n=1 Tax=Novosphingobium sp. BL-52-GroH TaxID=3349877 RepID=UPI00384E406A
MSDLGFALAQTTALNPSPRSGPGSGPRVSLVEALGRSAGFRPSSRFGGVAGMIAPEPAAPILADLPDPVAEAYARGYAEGHAQASDEAEAHHAAADAARAALALSFARLDAVMEEDLRLRLRDTVAALCEAALAPLAIDEAALTQRIARAVAMLARADDERVVRLHPADIDLVSERLRAEWQVMPDASLERGTVRVEGSLGGVEDGPASWRMAIAEALHQG